MTKEYATDVIEDVIQRMCDRYCKMTDLGTSEDDMDVLCADCPLENLRELEGKEIT